MPPVPAVGSYTVRTAAVPGVSRPLSSMNSRLTMRRMTSRGVKCSPAVSLDASANLRISSSKARPMSWLLTWSGCSGTEENRSATW